jgi:type VI secretion system protein ImpK
MHAAPHGESADADRTIVVPRPAPARAPPAPRARASNEVQRLVAGVNPLLDAAHVLLALVVRLRATTMHADPDALRERLLERLRDFEAAARGAGVAAPKVGAARYLLCTFLDEVIAETPWGVRMRPLLAEFHDEETGGDKAFKLLERLGEDVAANADLLELFYVCLALGFEGRYRGSPRAREQLDAIAERLYALLRRPEAGSRTLSLRWRGVAPPRRQVLLSVLPLWSLFALAAAVVIGSLLWMNLRLDARASPVLRQILGVPAALAADRFAVAAAARPRVGSRLQSDIAAGRLAVRDEALRSVVVVPADSLFAPGSARVEPSQRALLARVAKALADLPGQIVVSGHTDSEVTPSLQFPSNWHLSRARALAVADLLANAGIAATRLRGEGRADAEPIAAESTPAERARNRRIEIELVLPHPDD